MATVMSYFDYGSPYSYLAWQRVRRFPERYADVDVVWEPVSAGHIFAQDGTRANAFHPNQRAYMERDCAQWAEAYGVPFVVPDSLPVRSIDAARLHCLARAQKKEALWMEAVFLAHFSGGKDISDPKVLTGLVAGTGLAAGPDDLARPELKEWLQENTQKAYAAGAPGVPYTVHAGRGYWGQDRLEWLEAHLAGEPWPRDLPVEAPSKIHGTRH